jgi:hypothetical protein
LPENFSFIGLKDADKLQVAEADGVGPIAGIPARYGAGTQDVDLGGTTVIKGDSPTRVANASLLIDAQASGSRATTRFICSMSPFRAATSSISNRSMSLRAAKPSCADTPVGKLGLSVCYDMRFPELYRDLVSQGAEWLAMPAAFTVPTGRRIGRRLLRARAIENLCYVVAPAQAGTHTSGRETYGDTLIVDYWGQVLSRLAKGSGVITADIDLAKQKETRARFPALDNRAGVGRSGTRCCMNAAVSR